MTVYSITLNSSRAMPVLDQVLCGERGVRGSEQGVGD